MDSGGLPSLLLELVPLKLLVEFDQEKLRLDYMHLLVTGELATKGGRLPLSLPQ